MCDSPPGDKALAIAALALALAVFVVLPLVLIALARGYRLVAAAVWVAALALGSAAVATWSDGDGVAYWYAGLAAAWLVTTAVALLRRRFALPIIALVGAAGPSVTVIVGFVGLLILTETCLD